MENIDDIISNAHPAGDIFADDMSRVLGELGAGAGAGAQNLQPEHATVPAQLALPAYAETALTVLEAAGYEAWVVGGFVRDAFLCRPSADVDIACSAHWEDTQEAFEEAGFHTYETGVAHGTLTVMVGEHSIEVTTYRADGTYTDARHPDAVQFVRSIEEDLARRDFTINAMAYHPQRGLLDPYNGRADLRAHLIRAVGEPKKRFAEDALRILRASRFAAQLGFAIELATYKGMLENKGLVPRVAVERMRHELELLLCGTHAGTVLETQVDVLSAALPELVAMKGFDQCNPYHIYDVLGHTAHVVDGTPPYPLVRWAALFHDMGKPATFFKEDNGRGHFYGHPRVSVQIAQGVMRRLKMPSAFEADVLRLVERHDDVIEPTPRAVKRVLAKLDGRPEMFRALVDLRKGDARGQAPRCAYRVEENEHLLGFLGDILAANEAFTLKRLAIKGEDVIEAGVPQGPAVGNALNRALEAVIDGKVPNTREALLNFVRHINGG